MCYTRTMETANTEFSVNQKIVYPSQGVGTITEIFEKTFKDELVSYYRIYLDVSDMYVMVPVSVATSLGIRAIVSAQEAQEALDMIGQEFEPPTSDWKLRYQMNLDLLKKGTISDIAAIVRSLYHRSKVKELPVLERKLYDNAKKLLEDEIAEALGKTSREVEMLLHAKLEPLGIKTDKKTPLIDEDEDDELEEEIEEEKSSDYDSDGEDDDADDDLDDGDE